MLSTVDLGTPNFRPNIDLLVSVVLVLGRVHFLLGHRSSNDIRHFLKTAMDGLPTLVANSTLHEILKFGGPFIGHSNGQLLMSVIIVVTKATEVANVHLLTEASIIIPFKKGSRGRIGNVS